MNIAVLCPSDIALRRFMPAVQQVEGLDYIGIGVATPAERLVGLPSADSDIENDGVNLQRQRAKAFKDAYGGSVFNSFRELLDSPLVEAVYIPLPPSLHFPWAKRALEAGKHVMLEKPFTVRSSDTRELLSLATAKGLAVHENYMFAYHLQINSLRELIAKGEIGEVRMVRIDFGFPFRGANDFRYSKDLGGGALLDCGGYTLKLASILLGPSTKLMAASLSTARGLEVDVFGSAMLENEEGAVAQVSFGMDNDYRCSVDVWGSEASLVSGRILTAPVGFEPTFAIRRNGEEETVKLNSDDSFRKSIEHFRNCIIDPVKAAANRDEISHQAGLVESFFHYASLPAVF